MRRPEVIRSRFASHRYGMRRYGRTERKKPNDSLGSFLLRFGERCRAKLRADIWIPRPPGGVCRRERLTKRGGLKDIAADFGFSDCGAPEYTAGSAGNILSSRLPCATWTWKKNSLI